MTLAGDGVNGEAGKASTDVRRRHGQFQRHFWGSPANNRHCADSLGMGTAATSQSSTSSLRTEFFSMTCKGGALIVRPAGPRLGEGEACVISSEVRAAIQDLGASMTGLVIDLSEVQIMSSFGLGLCIELRNCARSTRLGTILYGVSHELRDLFRLVKIERLFSLALTPRDLAEAIAA